MSLLKPNNCVTFEVRMPVETKNGPLKTIEVGWFGTKVCYLLQSNNPVVSKEGIKFGDWFIVPCSGKSIVIGEHMYIPSSVMDQIRETLLSITPAGQDLNDLKKAINTNIHALYKKPQKQKDEKTC